MSFISIENRIKIVEIYYENGRCVENTFHKIPNIFGRYDRPSEHAIRNLVKKFRSTGLVHNIAIPICARPGHSTENIAAVRESVEEDPNLLLLPMDCAIGTC